ncbi:haloacid dehalogenase-like hydrolase domain-containing protein 2 isoform X2 [Aplysia californica]|uniref:Haloacid dehalogenase-like hydrolase domain-containing protein 2 n=1 Tax=Aplysia californica TaxID=6500 RepID=A0ABM0JWJ4_APLCA|nr:haloacid dehalogenase-like hydrolase domain-containing protein 2 isoform X2 [Aplysia californica]
MFHFIHRLQVLKSVCSRFVQVRSIGSRFEMSGDIKAVLIDLSGTLHVESDPTPGAVDALKRLRQQKDIKVKFVTNTTKESKAVLMRRLLKIGFDVSEEDVFTSLSAARQLVDAQNLRPYLLVDEKAMEDFEGVPQEDPNSVVVGLAPDRMNYEDLNTAMRLLQSGASLIAIHKAKYYRRSDGLALGPGPFVCALEFATGVSAHVVGKPSENFFLSAIAGLDCRPEECVMIGDDVSDDIHGAQTIGMKGILVKTGKYRDGDQDKISPPPHRVCADFAHAVEEVLSGL